MPIESAAVANVTQRKTTNFFMRMDPVIKQAGENAAAADRRSLAGLLERLLEDYCKRRGFLTEDGRPPKKPSR
jgi:hypothetical protein